MNAALEARLSWLGGRFCKEYTHSDVFTRGITEGWAEAETDPTRIDWDDRLKYAAIPFKVINGRPVKPGKSTGIHRGRGELGHWGEKQAADAIVFTYFNGLWWVLLIERDDDHGWAIPGGCLDLGENPLAAAARELEEETGLRIPLSAAWRLLEPRVVPDPRATNESWMVTWPAAVYLTVDALPVVQGADDARRAVWVPAESYDSLVSHLKGAYGGKVFAAHTDLLAEVIAYQ